MNDIQLGDQVWIINFEEEFYLLSKQTVTEILAEENKIECEDDFNTFHVSYEDIYRTESEAIDAMINRLKELRSKFNN